MSGKIKDLNYNDIIFGLCNELELIISEESVTSSNIVKLLLYTMKSVEQYKYLTGKDKKNIVIRVLYSVVNKNIDKEVEKQELKLLIDLTIPTLIDSIISIDKREFIIKSKSFFKKLLKCCSKKKMNKKKRFKNIAVI